MFYNIYDTQNIMYNEYINLKFKIQLFFIKIVSKMLNTSILYHWECQYRIRKAVYNAALLSNNYL